MILQTFCVEREKTKEGFLFDAPMFFMALSQIYVDSS